MQWWGHRCGQLLHPEASQELLVPYWWQLVFVQSPDSGAGSAPVGQHRPVWGSPQPLWLPGGLASVLGWDGALRLESTLLIPVWWQEGGVRASAEKWLWQPHRELNLIRRNIRLLSIYPFYLADVWWSVSTIVWCCELIIFPIFSSKQDAVFRLR